MEKVAPNKNIFINALAYLNELILRGKLSVAFGPMAMSFNEIGFVFLADA